MKKSWLYTIFISFWFILYSCGGSIQNNSVSQVNQTSDEELYEEITSEIFILSWIVHFGQLFESKGLKYIKGVGHDPFRVDSYNAKIKRFIVFMMGYLDEAMFEFS